jgi:hypothetical protein
MFYIVEYAVFNFYFSKTVQSKRLQIQMLHSLTKDFNLLVLWMLIDILSYRFILICVNLLKFSFLISEL